MKPQAAVLKDRECSQKECLNCFQAEALDDRD